MHEVQEEWLRLPLSLHRPPSATIPLESMTSPSSLFPNPMNCVEESRCRGDVVASDTCTDWHRLAVTAGTYRFHLQDAWEREGGEHARVQTRSSRVHTVPLSAAPCSQRCASINGSDRPCDRSASHAATPHTYRYNCIVRLKNCRCDFFTRTPYEYATQERVLRHARPSYPIGQPRAAPPRAHSRTDLTPAGRPTFNGYPPQEKTE